MKPTLNAFLSWLKIREIISLHQIEVNGLTVDVVRKNIKNLHLAVYPPAGRIRVAAPLLVDDEAVRLAVIARLPWIKRQQVKFQEQERQTPREYVSGESHYFQGHRYLLNIIEREGPPQVVIRNKKYLDLHIRPGVDALQRERILSSWYRAHLRAAIPAIIAAWEPKLGVEVDDFGIRHMKTRWGTCNIEQRRIWLNLELAKKSARCLEYIVIHEMMHLLERHHNERFLELMNQHLPSWRQLREELNRAPLAHEEWGY
jgi:predicted metal-dependent hydrolase